MNAVQHRILPSSTYPPVIHVSFHHPAAMMMTTVTSPPCFTQAAPRSVLGARMRVHAATSLCFHTRRNAPSSSHRGHRCGSGVGGGKGGETGTRNSVRTRASQRTAQPLLLQYALTTLTRNAAAPHAHDRSDAGGCIGPCIGPCSAPTRVDCVRPLLTSTTATCPFGTRPCSTVGTGSVGAAHADRSTLDSVCFIR